MCGISGIVTFDGSQPSERQLKQMTEVMVHRGPDDSGFMSEPGIGLGFRRLSIIDLAEGHQPLSNEDDSVWIIFNGEIYNYKELRKRLVERGHRFKTHSDTEIIVHLYEEYGEACVKHLRGMFGFAVWDRKKQRLFGARDHFGIKPFYYAHGPQCLMFASEIKSILATGEIGRNMNTRSLIHYLSFQYVPEPETMFAGIHKLPPAHTITVERDGRVRLEKYWDPLFQPVERSFESYVEELREALLDSVRHHMVSDVDRGCFLSSGIDSTAIAAHMRRIEPIKTFSVGFKGPNNETEIAAETARALGTEHYAKVIDKRDFLDTLQTAVWHQDEPVADPSAIALYHVAQLAGEHVKVILSGEGADELFGGYRIYREPMALRPVSWMPLPMKRVFHQMVKSMPGRFPGKNYLLRGTTPLEERFLGNARIFSEDLKREMMASGFAGSPDYEPPYNVTAPYYEKSRFQDPVTRMQYIDMNTWLPGDILMKADKMTMAHSLELRVPFLDKELFELAARIPAAYRIADGTTKYIFRRAMEGIVPDFILNRPKLGFPVPVRDWLKGAEGDRILETVKSGGIGDYIRLDKAERLLKAHREGVADYSRNLWVLYILAIWHQTYRLAEPDTLKATM